jgi:hypothetical protein
VTDDAVSHGIKSTAGVVTSAALVMWRCSTPSPSPDQTMSSSASASASRS